MDNKLTKSALNLSDIDSTLQWCELIANSNTFPVKTKEEVFSALILAEELGLSIGSALMLSPKLKGDALYAVAKGKELGIPAMTAIENIYPYEQKGVIKSVLGIHVINNLLLKNNIEYDVVLEFEPMFYYAKADGTQFTEEFLFMYKAKDGKFVKEIRDGYFILEVGMNIQEAPKNKIIIAKTNICYGYITAIIGCRKINGTLKYVVSTYSTSDAIVAGLSDKDNHKKFPKEMLFSRALGNFGRRIADDIIQGGLVENEITISRSTDNIDNIEEAEELS